VDGGLQYESAGGPCLQQNERARGGIIIALPRYLPCRAVNLGGLLCASPPPLTPPLPQPLIEGARVYGSSRRALPPRLCTELRVPSGPAACRVCLLRTDESPSLPPLLSLPPIEKTNPEGSDLHGRRVA
jgi:hypothetical protein